MKFNKSILWDIIGYASLALCIIGQITVGQFYMFAQIIYLIANLSSTIRSICLRLPLADNIRNVVFTGITIALIIVRIF